MGLNKNIAGALLAAFTVAAIGVPSLEHLSPSPVARQAEAVTQKATSSCGSIAHANSINMAYIKSPNQFVNDEARSGLRVLANTLAERTTVEPESVVACDIEQDDLSFYPFIYWPVTSGTAPLSTQAREKLQNYLDAGGVLVIDIRDAGMPLGTSCRPKILDGIKLKELAEPGKDHSLRKSLYLNTDLQGSRNFGKLCVETPGTVDKNRASSIIIGEKNWAGAWAGTTLQGKPAEREKALRAGINMVMYGLNGNYKNDAIHTPSILEKLEKRRTQP